MIHGEIYECAERFKQVQCLERNATVKRHCRAPSSMTLLFSADERHAVALFAAVWRIKLKNGRVSEKREQLTVVKFKLLYYDTLR
jgi:hypothetical protein